VPVDGEEGQGGAVGCCRMGILQLVLFWGRRKVGRVLLLIGGRVSRWDHMDLVVVGTAQQRLAERQWDRAGVALHPVGAADAGDGEGHWIARTGSRGVQTPPVAALVKHNHPSRYSLLRPYLVNIYNASKL